MPMKKIADEAVSDFVQACHRTAEQGLLRCSSGNLSRRLDEERMLISCTGSWLENIRPEQVAVCRIADGSALTNVRPSVEAVFHAGVLRRRPKVNVVLHFQSPCATTLACRRCDTIDFNILPEVPYYIGPIAVVPYLTPGSPPLAAAVIEALGGHDMVILQNHGLATVGTDYNDAIQKAVIFELACRILLSGGPDIQRISVQDVETLRNRRSRGV
jgi:ribulose-5-phosphate 4-epimerase/fuculose-1-phosphate aldolase